MFKKNATKEMGFNPLMYPNIMKLIRFKDIIAVSSAECEKKLQHYEQGEDPRSFYNI